MKTAKLFKNGQSQAVRLPKEFRITGSEVYIKKQGDVIVYAFLKKLKSMEYNSLILFKFLIPTE